MKLRSPRPGGWIGSRLDDGAAARCSPLVNWRTECMFDLLHQDLSEGLVSFQAQTAVLKLLGKSSQSSRSRFGHLANATTSPLWGLWVGPVGFRSPITHPLSMQCQSCDPPRSYLVASYAPHAVSNQLGWGAARMAIDLAGNPPLMIGHEAHQAHGACPLARARHYR